MATEEIEMIGWGGPKEIASTLKSAQRLTKLKIKHYNKIITGVYSVFVSELTMPVVKKLRRPHRITMAM